MTDRHRAKRGTRHCSTHIKQKIESAERTKKQNITGTGNKMNQTFFSILKGVIFSLTDPAGKEENLSLNIASDPRWKQIMVLVLIYCAKTVK